MPYVHPSVFTDGWMKFVPHDVPKICGSQLPVLSLTMGVFWGITMGGAFLVVVLLIWLASGTSMDASINGWGYTIVKSVRPTVLLSVQSLAPLSFLAGILWDFRLCNVVCGICAWFITHSARSAYSIRGVDVWVTVGSGSTWARPKADA